ncbi:MAG: transglycosylase domain-containing protein [Bacteriovoracaceae bacterium]|nr:transglycosylase domain-containing protein [Bacteriovoracaceae bacterium]
MMILEAWKNLKWILLIAGALVVGGWGSYKLYFAPRAMVVHLHGRYPVMANDAVDSSRYVWHTTRPKTWVALKKISPHLINAVLVSEDVRFYTHHGVDWDELHNAIREHFKEGRRWRGASTITQQLAKNLFLGPQKTLGRKIEELILTWHLEHQFSKDQILEYYLNVVEFGERIYGIAAAGQFYFQKRPSQLQAREAAFLAMLLPSPKRHAQSFYQHELTAYAKKIMEQILFRMAKFKLLKLRDLSMALHSSFTWENPTFATWPLGGEELEQKTDELDPM